MLKNVKKSLKMLGNVKQCQAMKKKLKKVKKC